MNVILSGSGDMGGAYVLRLMVRRNLRVRFGRFQKGRAIGVPAGVYVYVGSAMGSEQALGRRVVRHATRRGKRRPHDIRDEMIGVFGSEALPKGEKRLRWHIDFLLDRYAVDLTHVVAVRAERRLEGVFAEMFMADVSTGIIVAGLGAADVPGHTHLLRASEAMGRWCDWVGRLKIWGSI